MQRFRSAAGDDHLSVVDKHVAIGADGNAVWTTVKNNSAMDIELQRTGSVGPERLSFPAGATTLMRVTGAKPDEPIELSYTATNFWIAPETGLPITLKIVGK